MADPLDRMEKILAMTEGFKEEGGKVNQLDAKTAYFLTEIINETGFGDHGLLKKVKLGLAYYLTGDTASRLFAGQTINDFFKNMQTKEGKEALYTSVINALQKTDEVAGSLLSTIKKTGKRIVDYVTGKKANDKDCALVDETATDVFKRIKQYAEKHPNTAISQIIAAGEKIIDKKSEALSQVVTQAKEILEQTGFVAPSLQQVEGIAKPAITAIEDPSVAIAR